MSLQELCQCYRKKYNLFHCRGFKREKNFFFHFLKYYSYSGIKSHSSCTTEIFSLLWERTRRQNLNNKNTFIVLKFGPHNFASRYYIGNFFGCVFPSYCLRNASFSEGSGRSRSDRLRRWIKGRRLWELYVYFISFHFV